jgi:phosphatidylglycerol:prolipoprotein diacylglycerol transferase
MFPRLFTWGSFTLHTYGLLVAIGFLAGIYTAQRFARRFGLNPDQIFNLSVYLAIGAIVGAKLFLILQDWRFYLGHPGQLLSLSLLESAGIFYGGLIVALLVSVVYVRRQKLSWLAVGDAIVPGVAVGHAIGRLGCFSAGCCWGKATKHFWGIIFTSAYAHRTVGVPLGVPLEPTQLLGSAAEVVLFIILWRMASRRKFIGQLTAVYLVLYGIWRFCIDFLRYYSAQALFFHNSLTAAQLTSLCAIALGLGIYAAQARKPADVPAVQTPVA